MNKIKTEKKENKKNNLKFIVMATKNKIRQFEIPKHHIGAFFSHIDDSDLEYSLVEVDQDNDELIIEIEYSPNERDEVMNMIELLDEWKNDDETEEEESEEN